MIYLCNINEVYNLNYQIVNSNEILILINRFTSHQPNTLLETYENSKSPELKLGP